MDQLINSLAYLMHHSMDGLSRAEQLLAFDKLNKRLREKGVESPVANQTPYFNTIGFSEQPEFPGDLGLERRIMSYNRWNAMAMVVNANREESGIGGHISTFASSATLYEVGFNHFFHGHDGVSPADMVYFQGHASPGIYARAYLEGRLQESQLRHFRRELTHPNGLSSYPHPYLMPEFWQFPTVSMGLGPILSIYQARFNRYMSARKLLKHDRESKVWCFVGDGETDEPETLGAISMASRESLDNLIWVVNCNLQRLDGPVRGNGKIIQELERMFLGAGWNVIKVIWGSNWDPLFEKDTHGYLLERMEETVDGEYQKYSVSPGSYIRKHFFGKRPELKAMVNHLTDHELQKLLRGGHDLRKVYSAYQSAVEHKGRPTVILAKTIKGYGLGEAGEGRNITHQQKKLNERELREFRSRFNIPISDESVVNAPFFRPPGDGREMNYLKSRRKKLGGSLPQRKVDAEPLDVPGHGEFHEIFKGSGQSSVTTTQAFVRILSKLMRDKRIGDRITPIIPDEARTFGMDGLFREFGIYSSQGQRYEPVDSDSISYYKEAKNGQIFEEGITESGSMASFIAAGTAHASHGTQMIPFYTFYSMFGFQRVGDLMWLAGDMRAKGFLCGATSGRTTLNGEGLQHQDGQSLHLVSVMPNLNAFDPAYAYELAVIIQDGLKRMYQDGEEIIYYLSLYNEGYPQPEMPPGVTDGILRGMYKFKKSQKHHKNRAHLLGSGSLMNSALEAQKLLEAYEVSADVWSVTSYKQLRSEAIQCRRWNMLHPTEAPRTSYIERTLKNEQGAFVAVSDNIRSVPDQIAPWIPEGMITLGTDGFGRSDTREELRQFFEVDGRFVAIAALHSLSQRGQIGPEVVAKAIQDFDIHPEKANAISHDCNQHPIRKVQPKQ